VREVKVFCFFFFFLSFCPSSLSHLYVRWSGDTLRDRSLLPGVG